MNYYTDPSILSMKFSKKGTVFLEKSGSKSYIPVVSNTVLIKNCEAKVLGASCSAWSDLSEEVCIDSVVYDNATQPSDLCEPKFSESEFDFDLISASSSEPLFEINPSPVPSVLTVRLQLLEEISSRILGDPNPSIPKIEKVEFVTTPIEFYTADDDESTIKPEEEEEDDESEPKDVQEYLDEVKFAEELVDNVLHSSKQVCKYKHDMNISLVGFKEGHKPRNITWPTIENFSVEFGCQSINKYIQKSFALVEAWKYKVTFLIAQSDKVSDFYNYEAKFSIPTPKVPIPQVTASVYFTLEVSRVIPKDLPVRVTFTMESFRRVMLPGEVEVNDEMLLRVLHSKLAVFKELYF